MTVRYYAAQCDLICHGREDQHQALLQGMKAGKVSRQDLERCGMRVLRMIRKNNVLESR